MGQYIALSLVILPAKLSERRLDGSSWQRSTLHPNSICYTPEGIHLGLRWTSTTNSVNLIISSSWLSRDSSRLVPLLPSEPRFGFHDEITARLIRCAAEDNLAGSPFGAATGEAYALAALARVCPASSNPGLTELRQPSVIRRAAEYIHDHLDEKLTTDAVASAAGYEGDLFSFLRLFKQSCGVPPHQYIIHARLVRALEMLKRQGSDVTSVALGCGFASPSHFSSAFKRKWGCSPSYVANSR
ncbi:helix-turn-helix domain-containing protein [Paraburkholderia youngii]|uniref:helix-turn-helix domain-containing protein n=1 Tax=Paraburkholderia youngii TaxID=2782701 RepID=UPI00359F1EA0